MRLLDMKCVAALAGTFLVFAAMSVHGEESDEILDVLAFGNSLVSGYGLAESAAFPARLEAALIGQGIEARVVNAGVAGDTTAAALARLDWALGDKPDLVIVELGANDALRGLDPSATRANLDAMLKRLDEAGVRVLLAGMLAPRNLGAEYAAGFDSIFPDLARMHGVELYPFFLDGVAADPSLNQPDGIHPNEAGVQAIVRRILPHVLRAAGRL
jgi:acyl-CoA thioesterase-1